MSVDGKELARKFAELLDPFNNELYKVTENQDISLEEMPGALAVIYREVQIIAARCEILTAMFLGNDKASVALLELAKQMARDTVLADLQKIAPKLNQMVSDLQEDEEKEVSSEDKKQEDKLLN